MGGEVKLIDGRAQTVKELRRILEFYQELGFEYLPVKKEDIMVRQDTPVRSTGRSKSSKEKALERLRREIGDCRRCKLSKSRKNIVFGEGDPQAKLMFIGEGPGRDEDIQARPFVGDAGRLLTRLIEKLGLRREGVYIANIVKCRPPLNREPEEDEIRACKPFIEEQIEIVKPKVIVCLGKVSAQTLMGTDVPISRLRGHFFSFKNIPVMPTFHPAYLLRNPKDKRLTWDDMQKVLKRLNMNNT